MPTDPQPMRGDLPAELRQLAFERICAAAPDDRRRVADELAQEHPAHRDALRALVDRVARVEHVLVESFPDLDDEPASIGGLPVLARIGAGAFGIVYLCEQAEPVVRRVAVKVLRPGAGDRETLRRFAAEQQLLATLSHPTITHVYDAGNLPDGRPFFVMEHVDGQPITAYCRAHAVPWDERLRLFVDVCRGVEHAHAHGVVHRDIKPGNVLVVAHTGRPQPKIIDFGIAKALGRPRAADRTAVATDAGQVLGTPGYMSPEQARGEVDNIDERADVFALGGLLYEMLTGELPWPRGAQPADAPRLASTRLAAQAQSATGEHAAELRRLTARVRGDIDWILRRATQPQREERYASVGALIADIENRLAGRPVSAGPPTWRYLTRNFAHRHRAGLAVAAAIVVCAVATAAYGWRASQAAATHLAAATTAAESLLRRAVDLVDGVGPSNDAARRDLAGDALGFYDRWLADRPEDRGLRRGRVRALVTLSQIHWELGQAEAASFTAQQACEELAALAEPALDAPLIAHAERHRARALFLSGRLADAEAGFARAIAACAALYAADAGPHAAAYAAVLNEGGGCNFACSHPEQGAEAKRQAVAVAERALAALTPTADRDERAADRARASADLATVLIGCADAEIALGSSAAAEAALARAESLLPAIADKPWRLAAVISRRRADVAIAGGDPQSILATHEHALAAFRTWVEREPQQVRARLGLAVGLKQCVSVRESVGDTAGADAAIDEAIALGARPRGAAAGLADPEARMLRRSRWEFAQILWHRFRRSDVRRARDLLAPLGDDPMELPFRPQRWEVMALRAQFAELLSTDWLGADAPATTGSEPDAPGGDASAPDPHAARPDDTSVAARRSAWRAVAEALPTRANLAPADAADACVEAWVGVARAALAGSDSAAAAAAIANAAEIAAAADLAVDVSCRSRVLAIEAQAAVARGAWDRAEAHLADMLRQWPNWWTQNQAGTCHLAAARLRAAAGDSAGAVTARAAAAAALQAVVAELEADAEAAPGHPGFVVPWGFAHLGLAEIEAERGATAAAAAHLDRALPALRAVAHEAVAEAWDAPRFAAAEALARRLATTSAR